MDVVLADGGRDKIRAQAQAKAQAQAHGKGKGKGKAGRAVKGEGG